jgi:hypothetical protein
MGLPSIYHLGQVVPRFELYGRFCMNPPNVGINAAAWSSWRRKSEERETDHTIAAPVQTGATMNGQDRSTAAVGAV